MKQSLQLKMGQHLTMTPQLQQAIRLLQLSTLDLQQEIQEIVDTNPMLEVAEESENNNDSASETIDKTLEAQASTENSIENSESGNEAITDTAGDAYQDNAVETDFNTDDTSRNDDADWQDNIASETPVDSNWDDIYTSAPSSSGQSLDFNEMADLDNHNSSSVSL
ncbi:MAG: RNA polymerase factor sigma-54, partial [Pseudomonadales bacterium]